MSNLHVLEQKCQLIFAQSQLEHQRQRKQRKRDKRTRQVSDKRAPSDCNHLPSLGAAYLQRLEAELARANLLPATTGVHLDKLLDWSQQPQVSRAVVHVLFGRGQHADTQRAIQLAAAALPASLDREIETIWDQCSYQLHQPTNRATTCKSDMRAVRQYRIRAKFPCPTMALRGKKRYSISEQAQQLMQQVLLRDPKPSRPTKETLSLQTGLSLDTVSNWFKNRRQRLASARRTTGEPPELPPTPTYCSSCGNQLDQMGTGCEPAGCVLLELEPCNSAQQPEHLDGQHPYLASSQVDQVQQNLTNMSNFECQQDNQLCQQYQASQHCQPYLSEHCQSHLEALGCEDPYWSWTSGCI